MYTESFSEKMKREKGEREKEKERERRLCAQKEVIAHQKLTKWCFDTTKLAAETFSAYIQII